MTFLYSLLGLGSCWMCIRRKPHTRRDIARVKPEVIECRL